MHEYKLSKKNSLKRQKKKDRKEKKVRKNTLKQKAPRLDF